MAARTSSQHQPFWYLQIGGWLLLTPLFAGAAVLVYPEPRTGLILGISRQAIGFVVTLGMWRIYRRWPSPNFKLARHAWMIVLCCLLATAVDELVAEVVSHAISLVPPPEMLQRGALILRFALYGAWSALYFAIRQELAARAARLRLARAEAASREAELYLLRAQINPHFLFNALNTIVAEAEGNPAVGDVAHAVADYLRYSLRLGVHHAPLGDELNALGNYLNVERAHHGRQRLEWQIDCTDEARMALAPTALVQPLVENAIKYGLRTSPLPLRLRIHARLQDGALQVAVENSGAWVTRQPGEEARDSTGIGLNNLRRRLALLYGEAAQLEVATPPGAVRVEVRVPAVPPAPDAEPAGRDPP